MLRKLKFIDIQNFQGFKRVRIPLSDFTVVVGESSSGKTTAFRALEFLFYGEWDPLWANNPEESTVVAITFDDGARILRMRKDAINQAAIAQGGETTKYKAFGATIPGIHSLINVKPIEIGNKSVNLNMSLQDDPIFMVSESRPIRAAWLGRLYGAHIINEMLRAMSKDKKNTDSKRKDAEDRLIALEEEIKAYSTLGEQDIAMDEAKNLLVTYQDMEKVAQDCNLLTINKNSLERDMWAVTADTKGIKAELESLAAMRMLSEAQKALFDSKVFVKFYVKLLKVDIKGIKEDLDTLESLNQLYKEDLDILENKHNLGIEGQRMALVASKTRAKLEQAILKGKKCPVCSQPVTEGDHKHIMEGVARLVGMEK